MMSGKEDRRPATELVRPDDREYVDALLFLISEAELLDANDFRGWLALLAPEVTYTMPVQTTRLRGTGGAEPPRSFHLNENRASLELRVKRLVESDSVWASNPPPRTRRFVSNLRVRRNGSAELRVSSYLLLMRSRSDRDAFDFISAERIDLLARREDGALELRQREISIDQARLGVASLPVPL